MHMISTSVVHLIFRYSASEGGGGGRRSNLPQKSSTVLSGPKFRSLRSKIPGSAPEMGYDAFS